MENILYLIPINFVSLFLFHYWISYSKEKGKNKAINEDIQSITKTVEEIKNNFKSNQAFLSSHLSVLSNQSTLINEKSIQVLNIFFEGCLEIKDLYSQNFGDFIGNKEFGQLMIDHQVKIELTHRKLYSSYHNLTLFHSKNNNIIEHANNIIKNNYRLLQIFKKHFGAIKVSLIREHKESNTQNYKNAVNASNETTKDYYNEQNPNLKLFYQNFDKLLDSLSIYFSEYGLNHNYNELKKRDKSH